MIIRKTANTCIRSINGANEVAFLTMFKFVFKLNEYIIRIKMIAF